MSDLLGNLNCWFSHAKAHISFVQDEAPASCLLTCTVGGKCVLLKVTSPEPVGIEPLTT